MNDLTEGLATLLASNVRQWQRRSLQSVSVLFCVLSFFGGFLVSVQRYCLFRFCAMIRKLKSSLLSYPPPFCVYFFISRNTIYVCLVVFLASPMIFLCLVPAISYGSPEGLVSRHTSSLPLHRCITSLHWSGCYTP